MKGIAGRVTDGGDGVTDVGTSCDIGLAGWTGVVVVIREMGYNFIVWIRLNRMQVPVARRTPV